MDETKTEQIAKVLQFRKPEPKPVPPRPTGRSQYTTVPTAELDKLMAQVENYNSMLARWKAGLAEWQKEVDQHLSVMNRGQKLTLKALEEMARRMGLDIPTLLR